MDLLQPLILTALICLIVGFALGFLVSSGRAVKDDPPAGGGLTYSSQAPNTAPVPPTGFESQPPPVQRTGMTIPPAQTVPRTSLNPIDALARALQPDSARPEAPKSIAAQVDEILQEKLGQASPPETRKIRLVEVPEKGVVVMIGLDSYEGVESVPEPGIRDLIHASVQEWEKRALQNLNPN